MEDSVKYALSKVAEMFFDNTNIELDIDRLNLKCRTFVVINRNGVCYYSADTFDNNLVYDANQYIYVIDVFIETDHVFVNIAKICTKVINLGNISVTRSNW